MDNIETIPTATAPVAPVPVAQPASEPKPTPAQAAAKAQQEKAAAQAKANLDAQKQYQAMVDKKFTNGKITAEVRAYVPSRLTVVVKGKKSEPRQCFIVNFGHPNVSEFRPCKEFSEEFQSEVIGNIIVAAVQESQHLPQ